MNIMNTDKTLEETQDEFDTEAALGDISADLFGQGEDEGNNVARTEGEGPESGAKPSGTETPVPPQTETPVENSQEVQELGAPKTWTKEGLAEWATMSPRAKQEVLKREEDFLKGITQYKGDAEIGQRYSKVVEPYAPILQAENIDPVQLFQSFAANHYLLSRGTPAQKIELAASLIHGYGIDFEQLVNFIGDRMISPPDPMIAQLQQQVGELQGRLSQQDQAAMAATRNQVDAEVEAFAKDPAHPYFDELINDIAKLIETGVCADLTSAYEHAVYANPTTRQKELDRLTAEQLTIAQQSEQTRRDKISRSTAADLSVDPKARNGTVPVGSVDDTLAETLAAIKARA